MKTLSKIALSLAISLGVANASFAETASNIQAAVATQTFKTADGLNLYLQKDAIQFYEETNATDKDLRLYNGLGHLLMLEKGGEIVTNDIANWINRRVK